MRDSTAIKDEMGSLRTKIEKLQEFRNKLGKQKISLTYGVRRDTAKMAGDKYEELDDEAKEIVKDTASRIYKGKGHVMKDLMDVITEYDQRIGRLNLEHQIAKDKEKSDVKLTIQKY